MSKPLHIVIVGAGIGGASTAILLSRLHGVKVSLYERDANVDARTQGYSLTIQDNGINALKELGLYDTIATEQAYRSTMHVMNKSGKLYFTIPADNLIQVERGRIREVFLHTLATQKVTINYGYKCIGYAEQGEKVFVKFEDKEDIECDILIAADGSRSVIRQQMFPQFNKQNYLGLYSLGYNIPMTHKAAQLFAKSQSVTGRGCRLIAKINYPNMSIARQGEIEKKWTTHKAIEAGVKSAFKDFYNAEAINLLDVEPLQRCIKKYKKQRDMNLIRKDMTDKDPLKAWKAGRVMLIGDACHPMSPFMGQGANIALEDSVALSKAVEKILSGAKVKDALNEFEIDMLNRSTKIVKAARFLGWLYSLKNPIACFLRDSLFTMVGWFRYMKGSNRSELEKNK